MCLFNFSHDCMMLSNEDKLLMVFYELKEKVDHDKLLTVFYGIMKKKYNHEKSQIPEMYISHHSHGILFSKPFSLNAIWYEKIQQNLQAIAEDNDFRFTI